MQLSNRQLTAFMAVAATLNFTRAAERLGITQSALSHRIRQLEIRLGTTLMNRSSRGVEMTEAGQRVLRFCQASSSLEEEILTEFSDDPAGELSGVLRIAAHSSILRPVLIPALAGFLRAHPRVQCEMILGEAKDLPGILKRAEADFMVMDRTLDWAGLTTHTLGTETYIAVESARHSGREDIYLDLDKDDRVTEEFFRRQETVPPYRRSFLSDVFGIIDGVRQGLGRAVVSQHLVRQDSGIRVLEAFDPVQAPVTLHHHTQPYYTRLHKEALEVLLRECPALLD